jgi:hypothetical protein
MKHLKNYKLFLEADVIPIQETDPVDIKMSKQSIETLSKQLTEYNTKKLLIDNVYKNNKDSVQLERELVKLLGDQAVQNGPDRNPFLVEWSTLARVQSDLLKMEQEEKNYEKELKLSTDATTKQAVNTKIQELLQKVNKTQAEYTLAKKKHDDNLAKIKKDMKENITKISNVNQK